jgi:ubiquinone/menaquinone biosynthesis C-methylase UbiE
MSSIAQESWSAFDPQIAKIYLDGYGSPSGRSKILMASVLKELYSTRNFHLADFGCGNGHLYGFFRDQGLDLRYTGYDFSTALLQAAEERYPGDPNVSFQASNIQDPQMDGPPADIALFSHVLEMLESPGAALAAARRLAPRIMIRFFEPPVERHDLVELRHMEVGPNEPKVPYLRRCFADDFYDLLLTRAGCRSVDVHQVDGDKDQIHILNF